MYTTLIIVNKQQNNNKEKIKKNKLIILRFSFVHIKVKIIVHRPLYNNMVQGVSWSIFQKKRKKNYI